MEFLKNKIYRLAFPAWSGTGPTGVVKAWEAAYCTFPHIHYFINTFLPLGFFLFEIFALEFV